MFCFEGEGFRNYSDIGKIVDLDGLYFALGFFGILKQKLQISIPANLHIDFC